MNQTCAIVEIVLLLLGAVIIGYVTAYLFYKSIYTKKIKAIEEINEGLNKEVSGLKAEKEGLQKSLAEKEDEIKALKKK